LLGSDGTRGADMVSREGAGRLGVSWGWWVMKSRRQGRKPQSLQTSSGRQVTFAESCILLVKRKRIENLYWSFYGLSYGQVD
jgi:hypothetical protein